MIYSIDSVENGEVNGLISNDADGHHRSSPNSYSHSVLSGRFFSLDRTKGHAFFVDSFFDLGGVTSNLSLSTINGVPFGEREDCIKVRIH